MSTKRSRLKRQPVIEFTEDVEDENEEALANAKIKSPIIWSHLPNGFIIQDLQQPNFDKAYSLIKEHFMNTEILCQNTNILSDQESIDDFMKQITIQLNDHCSIYAMHEGTKEMAGILILRILHKSDYGKVFSRVKLRMGEAYKKMCRVKAYLNRKSDIFSKYDCDKFLRCYLLAVHPKYRKRGIGFQMMRATLDIARSLNIAVVMGIFPSNQLQIKAKKLGLEVIHEVYYVDWVENGEMVFDDPGPGNYTIALMAGQVPSLD